MGTDIDTLYAAIQLLGKALDKSHRADSLCSYIQASLEDLQRRTGGIAATARPGVYMGGIAHGRARGITSTHPDYPPFVFVNARNVAAAMDRRGTSSLAGAYIDAEQLLLWDPDIIIVDESGLELVREDLRADGPLAGQLAAVRDNRVFVQLAYNSYAVNYEVVLINSWFIGKLLYPEAFADVDMGVKGDEILRAFLGQGIYERLLTQYSFQRIFSREGR
jgi:iron complex transport system substrate-binding protein